MPETTFEPSPVNVRIKLSALWTSMLFVFAYVDIFGLYRPDVLGTTAYVVIPSLMVFLALVLRPRVNRIANLVLAVVYAITIVAGAIGEWAYYVVASALEIALLAGVAYYAWTWPREPRGG